MNTIQIHTVPFTCFILSTFIFALIGCNDSNQHNITFDILSSSSKLAATDSVDLDAFDLVDVCKVEIIDSLNFFEHGRLPYKLSAWNKSSNQIIHGVYKGQGPDEVAQYIPVESYRKDAKYFADRSKRKLFTGTIVKDSFVTKEIKQFNDSIGRFFRLIDLNKDVYISTGLYEDGRFCIYDKKTNTITYSSAYPENDQTQKLSSIHKAALFVNSKIDINPNGERFVVADHGLLDIYRVNSNRTVESIKSICLHFPLFKLNSSGVTTISYEKNQPIGYIDIACTHQHIYLLYSDKTIENCKDLAFTSNTIHVYDWDGKPLFTYQTETDLRSISIHNETLLGLNTLNNRLYFYMLGNPDYYK